MGYKIAVCITFHYSRKREVYLKEVITGLKSVQASIDLTIICNEIPNDFKNLLKAFSSENFNLDFYIPNGLGHPFLLSWCHYFIFKSKLSDNAFSHFLYLEDDLNFKSKHFEYWLKNRDLLKPYGLYPGFFRFELDDKKNKVSTDVILKMSLFDCRAIKINNLDNFINIVYSYQGLFLYDRELMFELINSENFSPDFQHQLDKSLFKFQPFGIREKSALGLTFINVPPKFRSRIALPYSVESNKLLESCMIHHIPNNYALNPSSPLGKIKVEEILLDKSLKLLFTNLIKKAAKFFIEYTFIKL